MGDERYLVLLPNGPDAAQTGAVLQLSSQNGAVRRVAELGHDDRLPGLLRYGNWIQVVPMAVPPAGEVGGLPRLMEMMEQGEVQPELLIALRQLPEGFDPDTWGAARRKAWNYKFIVFSTDDVGNATSRVVERNYGEMQDLTEALFLSLDFEKARSCGARPERPNSGFTVGRPSAPATWVWGRSG